MMRSLTILVLLLASASVWAQAPNASSRSFHDARYHLSLRVPAGWTLTTRDGEVSTFHLDARSAPQAARLRAVIAVAENPYPLSTFSGAFLYFSVTPVATDASCSRQVPKQSGTREIAGQTFAHGYTEQASRICTESRDEVYTAYRSHACYRFDLVIHTFCRQVSGAKEITPVELDGIRSTMESILSTVSFR